SVVVVDVPHPGNVRAPADDLRGEIAAHAIIRGALARSDREVARLRLGGEVIDQTIEDADGRTVDRLEGDGGTGRRRRRERGVRGVGRGAAGRERGHQRRDGACNAARTGALLPRSHHPDTTLWRDAAVLSRR